MTICILAGCGASTEPMRPPVLPGVGSSFTYHSIYLFPDNTDDSSSLEVYTLTIAEKDVKVEGRNCVRFTHSAQQAPVYVNYLSNGNYAIPAYLIKGSVVWLEYTFGTRNTKEFVFTDSTGPGAYHLVKKDVMSIIGNETIVIQDSTLGVVKLLIRKMRVENEQVTYSRDTYLHYAPTLGMIVDESFAPQGSNFGRRIQLRSFTLSE